MGYVIFQCQHPIYTQPPQKVQTLYTMKPMCSLSGKLASSAKLEGLSSTLCAQRKYNLGGLQGICSQTAWMCMELHH